MAERSTCVSCSIEPASIAHGLQGYGRVGYEPGGPHSALQHANITWVATAAAESASRQSAAHAMPSLIDK